MPLAMLIFRDLSKNKTVSANFNLLCEGQKGHNTGRKGHFWEKGTKQGHSGQEETIEAFEVFFFSGGSLAREIIT